MSSRPGIGPGRTGIPTVWAGKTYEEGEEISREIGPNGKVYRMVAQNGGIGMPDGWPPRKEDLERWEREKQLKKVFSVVGFILCIAGLAMYLM